MLATFILLGAMYDRRTASSQLTGVACRWYFKYGHQIGWSSDPQMAALQQPKDANMDRFGTAVAESFQLSQGFACIGLISLCRRWFADADKDFDLSFKQCLHIEMKVIHATVANTEPPLYSLLQHLALLVEDPEDEVRFSVAVCIKLSGGHLL